MPALHKGRGFTLIELVMVIVITGVLAVVALPRLLDHTFDERGFHDAVKAALQHARHTALASRRYVCANVTAGSGSAGIVEFKRDTTVPESVTTVGCVAGGTALPLPSPGRGCAGNNQVCAPSGVTLCPLACGSVIFDPRGRSVTSTLTAQSVSISISGQPDVTVQSDTGFVQ